jgi:hypothetical protein
LESQAAAKNRIDSIVTSPTFSGSEGNRVNSTISRNPFVTVFDFDAFQIRDGSLKNPANPDFLANQKLSVISS